MLYRLQMLRAWAAIFVMMFHYSKVFVYFPPLLNKIFVSLFSMGWMGVDLFFVISGYIITKTYYESSIGATKFLLRRCVRIYSGYWLVLFPLLLFLVLSGAGINKYNILKTIFLFPQYKGYTPLGVAWTLTYELVFYALFALAMLLPTGGRKYVFYAAAPYSLVLLVIYYYRDVGLSRTFVDFLINPYLLEFMVGSALYSAKSGNGTKLLFFGLCWVAAIGLLDATIFDRSLIMPYQRIPRVFMLLPGLAMIVAWAVAWNPFPALWISKGLVKAGDASYMLYLVHGLVITMAMTLIGNGRWLLALPCIAITAALLLHYWLEKPIYKFLCAKLRINQK